LAFVCEVGTVSSMNYLETLLAEWFEYKGYFVRRNVRVGKRPAGGYEGELDVVAFHPQRQELIHVECSMDADTWPERERRLLRKFETGRKYIPDLFKGLNVPPIPLQFAVFGYGSVRLGHTLGDASIFHVKDVLSDIASDLVTRPIAKEAVPEAFSMLRTIQYMLDPRNGPGLKLSEQGAEGTRTFCRPITREH
jgi:hypothetical protein